MSGNESEDQQEGEVTEPVAEADVDDVEHDDDEDDVEGHMFGAALKPAGLRANTATTPDFGAIKADLNAYTVYGGLGEPLPGEVSRPTRDQ